MKALSEMSLEELWQLFPIFLVEHNEKWAASYAEMEEFLKRILADCPIHRISHIGSTAVQGIWAKDIVDILVETVDDGGPQAVWKKIRITPIAAYPCRILKEEKRHERNHHTEAHPACIPGIGL